MRIAREAVRNRKWSSFAGVLSGAPLSFQSGMSSLSVRGSSTAPDRMWAPISAPFSITQTETSWPSSAASCFRRIAALRPDGPPPTITTSYSMTSRSIRLLPIRLSRRELAARASDATVGVMSQDARTDQQLDSQQALALLKLYIEWGADEAIEPTPQSRLGATLLRPALPAQKPRNRRRRLLSCPNNRSRRSAPLRLRPAPSARWTRPPCCPPARRRGPPPISPP